MKTAGISRSVLDAAAAWLARRDRGFSSDEKSQFEAWRTADPEHSAAVARLDCSWSTMDRPLHSGVAGEVLRGLEIKARNRRRWRARATLVAALALMAAGSLWRAPQRTVAVSRPSAIVLMSARQILPDGTMVELRDSASIAVEFTMTQRRVTLSRGEAHFEVTKGDSRPFIVAAGGFEVRAVGTAFAVDHRLELIEVLVTEGLVAIAPRAPPADRPDIAATSTADTFVNAGENVAIAFESGKAIGPVSAVTVTEIAERLAWRSPRLEFTGTPLIEAIKFMNEHNRVQIVIDDASIAQVQVSGLFRADRADGFVEALETGFGIKAERRGHNDIVLRRAR